MTLVKGYEIERDVRMDAGDTVDGRRLHVPLRRRRATSRARTTARARGTVDVTRERQARSTTLHPEKRIYHVQQNAMTEAAIDTGLLRDLYVSLGEPVDGGAWSVRVYYKPFVDWIWGGCAADGARRAARAVATAATASRSGATPRAGGAPARGRGLTHARA